MTQVLLEFAADMASRPGGELFSVLETLFPLRFVSAPGGHVPAAWIFLQEHPGPVDEEGNAAQPRLSFALPAAADAGGDREIEIRFAHDFEVGEPFRGRRVRARVKRDLRGLLLRTGERVLADADLGPVWTVDEAGRGRMFRSAFPLPDLRDGEGFHQVFNGRRFLEMLPLLHFLKCLEPDGPWQNGPLRAAFIIDDPNLHSTRYGYADFRAIASDARRRGYHVAFATIPLDVWFTREAAARIFRENADVISLLVHGNDHAREELARPYAAAARDSLLRQSVARIAAFEGRSGLTVCRVMVPPHGACSNDMLAALPRCGFDGAAISPGSLLAHNPDRRWARKLGFDPAEMVEGCPVLPRWGFEGDVENQLLIAAYLGQALILRGHHQNLREGLEVLGGRADFINQLGKVRWLSVSNLSRLAYQWRLAGSTCRIRPFANALVPDIPDAATQLFIEEADSSDWRPSLGGRAFDSFASGKPWRLPAMPGDRLHLDRRIVFPGTTVAECLRRTPARLIVRRALTEARDRLMRF